MPMRMPTPATAAAVLAILAGAAGLGWWLQRAATPPEQPAVAVAPAPPPAPPAEPPSAPPAVRHPISAEPGTDASPSKPPPDLVAALVALLGRGPALELLLTDGFADRIVATVDNLPRQAAPARVWPVVPAAGRFTAAGPGPGETLIGADNAARYARHLALLERLEPRAAAQLYRRGYTGLQRAYENLGYPGAHFNDRLVDVIDLLLATPQPPLPLAVRLPAIGGPVQPVRPWVLYEYAEPSLQALPIGQRVLLRLDAEQRRRVQAWLVAFRSEVATP